MRGLGQLARWNLRDRCVHERQPLDVPSLGRAATPFGGPGDRASSAGAVNSAASSDAVMNGSLARAPVRSKTRCTSGGPPMSPNSQCCAREAASASSTRCNPAEFKNVTPRRSSTTCFAPDAVAFPSCSRTWTTVSISTSPNAQTRITSRSVSTTTRNGEGTPAWSPAGCSAARRRDMRFAGTRTTPGARLEPQCCPSPSERPDRSALIARPSSRTALLEPTQTLSATPG